MKPRTIFCRQSGSGIFLKEGNVSISVKGIDHASITAGSELLDFANDLLVIGVTKGRILAGTNNVARIVLSSPPPMFSMGTPLLRRYSKSTRLVVCG